MAEKKTTTSRGAGGKSKAALERERELAEALERSRRKRNITAIALFFSGLLLVALSLTGNPIAEEKTGWDHIHTFFRGVFGLSMFLVGPAMMYTSVMIALDKRKAAIIRRVCLLGGILLFLCGAAQILLVGEVGKIGEVFANGVALKGGGVAGIVVASPLMLLGRLGAGILVVLITFAGIMLMANISLGAFLRFAAKPFKSASEYARQQRELSRQDAEYIRETEAARIEAEKASDYAAEIEEKIESNRKYDSLVKVLPAPRPQEGSEEFETAEGQGVLETQDSQGVSGRPCPPKYNIHEGASDVYEDGCEPPPFDIERVENGETVSGTAFDAAVDEFRKEATDAQSAAGERANNVEAAIIGDGKPQVVIPERPPSDFDALAKFAEHQKLYSLPEIDLLDVIVNERSEEDIEAELTANSDKLIETLKSFGVLTKIVGVVRGPSVTRYEIQPAPGVKISKITGLTDDIALNLAAAGVRMEAPIPGKSAVGVEVPNKAVDMVTFRELIDSNDFRREKSHLGAVIGKAISGEIIISDIAKMPHLLIAGTTGSGKSVCVNSIIMSILYRATPDEVRIIMIDPKLVEFGIYGGIPHLLTPVVTDPSKAAGALKWAVAEMTERYTRFAETGVRDVASYNEKARASKNTDNEFELYPKIVIFIDELADLMMTAAKEVEGSICRLAQLARAAGIHLVIATQRPTVNVVTGLIKANIPSRIALKVASQTDSRTIIDTAGADKLLGKGDMLYAPIGIPKPVRVQGCWVSSQEIDRVVKHVKDSFDFDYDNAVTDKIGAFALEVCDKDSGGDDDSLLDFDDDKLDEAVEVVLDAGKASTSYLQLKLKLGYGRAARLLDIMEKMGVISKSTGASRPREVLISREEWYERRKTR